MSLIMYLVVWKSQSIFSRDMDEVHAGHVFLYIGFERILT